MLAGFGFCCPYCYLKHTIDFKVLWHYILFSMGTNQLRVFFSVCSTLYFMISLCASSERLSLHVLLPSPAVDGCYILLYSYSAGVGRWQYSLLFFFSFSALVECYFPESLEWDVLSVLAPLQRVRICNCLAPGVSCPSPKMGLHKCCQSERFCCLSFSILRLLFYREDRKAGSRQALYTSP